MTIDEIRDNFALLDEWDDRYRYVIELGRTLDPMPEAEHSAANKVKAAPARSGSPSRSTRSGGEPRLNYLGDSDAHIVRGLIAILLTLYSGHTPQQILATDAIAVFDEFGFREHLTPQRSNGLRAMVERIRSDAREALPLLHGIVCWKGACAPRTIFRSYSAARCWPRPIFLASCERATA